MSPPNVRTAPLGRGAAPKSSPAGVDHDQPTHPRPAGGGIPRAVPSPAIDLEAAMTIPQARGWGPPSPDSGPTATLMADQAAAFLDAVTSAPPPTPGIDPKIPEHRAYVDALRHAYGDAYRRGRTWAKEAAA